MTVIEHGTVNKSGMLLGVGLQVLIVCGDDPKSSLFVEAVQ